MPSPPRQLQKALHPLLIWGQVAFMTSPGKSSHFLSPAFWPWLWGRGPADLSKCRTSPSGEAACKRPDNTAVSGTTCGFASWDPGGLEAPLSGGGTAPGQQSWSAQVLGSRRSGCQQKRQPDVNRRQLAGQTAGRRHEPTGAEGAREAEDGDRGRVRLSLRGDYYLVVQNVKAALLRGLSVQT